LPKPEPLGDDAIYRNLRGTLESTKLGVWAECLFADPVGDVALLGVPDNQRFEDLTDAYEELTSSVPALRVKNARRKQQAWLLGLDDEWISDRMSRCLAHDLEPTPGMSGSPIVASDGAAIAAVNVVTSQRVAGPPSRPVRRCCGTASQTGFRVPLRLPKPDITSRSINCKIGNCACNKNCYHRQTA